jgi:two-component system, NtrC family, response regulator
VVERLVIMSDGKQLTRNFLYDNLEIKRENQGNEMPVPQNLEELKATKKYLLEHYFDKIEASFLLDAIAKADGNITLAAKLVGMQRSNFSSLMKKHQITSSKTNP